jgi:hypothetical protein
MELEERARSVAWRIAGLSRVCIVTFARTDEG